MLIVKAHIGIFLRKGRSEIMGLLELSKKLDESKGYNIFLIIISIIVLSVGFEKVWPVFLGFFIIALALHSLYKISKKQKPVCEYCGYVALDERELHNHQITCEKKK